MALVLFEDKTPPAYLEAVRKLLSSKTGQDAKNLIDASPLETLPDGRNLLVTLHTEGHIKKLPTNQIFITIDSRNKIKLNELNSMLDAIEAGGDAAHKLEDLDEHKGMNKKKSKNDLQASVQDQVDALAKAQSQVAPIPAPLPTVAPVDLAQELRANSETLRRTAEIMVAESKNSAALLLAEAKTLSAKADQLAPAKPRKTHKVKE
jgi:hypothetical protein